ncbi:MAG: hypothetical protein JXX29_11490 [Deltaproteobacteria bacterium]|nr:hypothetical protein [Deltaproteobacteria bacterium]
MNIKVCFLVVVVCSFLFAIPTVGAAASATEPGEESVVEEQRAPIGLDGYDLEEEEQGGKPAVKKRLVIPPYVSLQRENSSFKTVLPFFYYRERTGKGARKDVGLLPFYWSHQSSKLNTKVYFPFYWNIKSPDFTTNIVLQTYIAKNEQAFHFGFLPFFFVGKNKQEKSAYQIVLPPLFWNFKNKDGGLTYSLLYFNKREKTEFSRGVVPIYFSRKKLDKTVTTILPPLFWHISDPVNYKTTTVLPPLFFRTRENGWSAGVLPLFYFARDKNWSRNMVMPFYYGSRVNDLRSHYLPFLLSYWRTSDKLKQGGIAFLYHWYRFEGEYMNMYSPLVWRWGNTRTLDKNIFIPPLFYRGKSPVASKMMVGLVYWNFHDFHNSKTFSIAPLFAFKKSLRGEGFRTWVAPTFDFGKNPDGYHARIHPIFYVGREKQKKHLVVAPLLWHFRKAAEKNTVVFPLWWKFHNTEKRRLRRVVFPLWWQIDDDKYQEYNRVAFPFFWDFQRLETKRRTTLTFPPLFWRVRDANSARTGVLNVSLHKGKRKGNDFWTFNLFPLVLFGKPPAPSGARWELLHGLVGWRRQGHAKELKLFWIPFSIGD